MSRALHRGVPALSLALLFVLTGCSVDSPSSPPSADGLAHQGLTPEDVIPGQYIVVFRDEVRAPADLARQLAVAHGLTIRHSYEHTIKGFSAVVPEGRLEALQRHPLVAYVEPNAYMYIDTHERLRRDPRLLDWNADADRYASALGFAALPPAVNPPSGLDAVAVSSSRIDLTWVDNSGNEKGFEIHRSTTGPDGVFTRIATVGANVTSYSNTGLTAGQQYCYKVRAIGPGKSNFSPFSTSDCDTPPVPPPPSPPAAPTNLATNAVSTSQIDLTWTDNANNEDGFKIERRLGTQPETDYAQIAQVGANVTNYSDTGLDPSTQYCYRVRAFNGAGNSGYSNESCSTTQSPPPPPAAPTNLVATAVSSSQIDLTWTDNATNEDGFKIERCQGAGCANFAEIDQTGPNTTTYSNTGLTASTTYRYRVRAFNAGGNSAYSNEAEATTLPPPAGCSDTGNHDPLTELWNIAKVQADQNPIWQASTRPGCEITAEFYGLDTGVDSDHPDLNVAEIRNFVASEPGQTGEDGNGHGTHTAGTAAAKDGNGGVVGVAPGARVHGFRVCNSGGSCAIDDIIAGIDEITARRNANPGQPLVANMSLGGGANTSLDTAVRRSVNAGIVYTISAGNGVFNLCSNFDKQNAQNVSPARTGDDDINASNGSNGDTKRVNGVITTTSSTQSDTDANCNFGNPVTVAAPGVGVKSTWLNGGYNTISGTSMAAPHSAGAALLWFQNHAAATPTQVEQEIVNRLDPWTTDDLPNANGRLNVRTLN